MATVDANIANVALPTIARDLHVSPAASIWVVNAYQIGSVATLFAFAALGQLLGPTRVYSWGVYAFIAGSLAAALSHAFPILIASRLVQGLAASAIFSLTPVLYREIFPRAQLGRALGINATVIATSTAAGPVLGGVILGIAPWPWIYAINVPLGLANIALNRALPVHARRGGRLDLSSAFASALGFTLVIWGLGSFGRGQPVPLSALTVCAGAGAFGWFVRRQRRHKPPMLAVDLFAIPAFSLAAVAQVTAFTAQALAYVSLPFFFQRVLGVSPLASAGLLTSWPLGLGMTSLLAGRLSDRFSPRLLATIGLAAFACGLALYALLPAHPGVLQIVGDGAICGVGFGFFKSPNDRELMGNAPREKSTSAAGILAAVRTSGQAIGAALVAIVFAAFGGALAGAGGEAAVARATPATLWLAVAFALVAMVASSARLGAGLRTPRRPIPTEKAV